MAAIAQDTDRSQATLVDLDMLDGAVGAVPPATSAVQVRCTHVGVRRDRLVLELEVQVRARPARDHIEAIHPDVTGV